MRKRERPHLPYVAQWEGAIKNWTTKFIKLNQWRCERVVDSPDDLLHDCYLTFIKIKERYPRVVHPAHFMSLYTRSVRNWMHDRSKVQTKKCEVIDQYTTVDDYLLAWQNHIGDVTNQGYINALLAEAPEELRMAMNIFDNNPNSLISKKPHENLNMKLRRILGIEGREEPFDFTGVLLGLLKGA